MQNRFKIIFCNQALLVGGIIYCFVCMALCIYMVFVLNDEELTVSTSDKIGAQVTFAVLGIGMVAAALLCMPRWLSFLKLDNEGIHYYSAFRRQSYSAYKDYRYVYCASYKHTVALFMPKYIVISKRELSLDELEHINQVEPSECTIKIRYSQRQLLRIKSCVPYEFYHKICQAVGM